MPSQTVCTAMCAYDFENSNNKRCHFTVMDGSTCHLGTLDTETSVLASAMVADVHLKTSEYQ